MGETKLYGGFEITVLNAWKLGNTLTRLDEIENGDATFKNWLVISRELMKTAHRPRTITSMLRSRSV